MKNNLNSLFWWGLMPFLFIILILTLVLSVFSYKSYKKSEQDKLNINLYLEEDKINKIDTVFIPCNKNNCDSIIVQPKVDIRYNYTQKVEVERSKVDNDSIEIEIEVNDSIN
jgi:hypothetical protein